MLNFKSKVQWAYSLHVKRKCKKKGKNVSYIELYMLLINSTLAQTDRSVNAVFFTTSSLGKYPTRAHIQKSLARGLLRKVEICTCSCSILYPRFQFNLFSVFECCTESRVETVA